MQSALVESILANLNSGIILLDGEFSVQMVNSYVADFCGIPESELVGKNLGAISPQLYEKVLAGQAADELVADFFGKEKSIGYNLSPFLDPQGRESGHLLNFREMSEIFRARKELRHRERLAAMSEIVGRVAHEIRNPLFGMTAAAQILEMELPLEPGHKELMASLLRESRRLNELLNVLKESTGEVRLAMKPVDVLGLADSALEEFAALCREKRIVLRKEYAGEAWLSADGDRLKKVLVNLLRNAVEASAADGEIALAVVPGAEAVTITVSDRGKGIPPENLGRIFDIFFTTEKGRSGLGLFVCSRIVAAHGGTLTARNLPEGGAALVIELPRGELGA